MPNNDDWEWGSYAHPGKDYVLMGTVMLLVLILVVLGLALRG
jgi:hypothetical protein